MSSRAKTEDTMRENTNYIEVYGYDLTEDESRDAGLWDNDSPTNKEAWAKIVEKYQAIANERGICVELYAHHPEWETWFVAEVMPNTD